MTYENFQHSNVVDNNKSQGLNLCDIVGYGQMLKHDLTTHGPGMLKEATKDPVAAVLGGASVGLVAVGVVASSEALIGIGGAAAVCCGLAAAGKVAIDHLPKVSF